MQYDSYDAILSTLNLDGWLRRVLPLSTSTTIITTTLAAPTLMMGMHTWSVGMWLTAEATMVGMHTWSVAMWLTAEATMVGMHTWSVATWRMAEAMMVGMENLMAPQMEAPLVAAILGAAEAPGVVATLGAARRMTWRRRRNDLSPLELLQSPLTDERHEMLCRTERHPDSCFRRLYIPNSSVCWRPGKKVSELDYFDYSSNSSLILKQSWSPPFRHPWSKNHELNRTPEVYNHKQLHRLNCRASHTGDACRGRGRERERGISSELVDMTCCELHLRCRQRHCRRRRCRFRRRRRRCCCCCFWSSFSFSFLFLFLFVLSLSLSLLSSLSSLSSLSTLSLLSSSSSSSASSSSLLLLLL